MANRKAPVSEASTTRYKGLLAKPLDLRGNNDPHEEIEVRLDALMGLFGIDLKQPDSYRRLSLALAFRHVPAFRLPETWADIENWRGRGSGPKSDNLLQRIGEVIVEVEDALNETKNLRAACRKLTRGRQAKFHVDPKRLERAFYRYRNKLRGFERLIGVPFARLCANYPKSCVSGDTYMDETLTACARPGSCRLFSACQEVAQQLRSGASERGQIEERLHVWRSCRDWATPAEARRRGRAK